MKLRLESPIGTLLVEYDADAVRSLRFCDAHEEPSPGSRTQPAPGDRLGQEIAEQLRAYFEGDRHAFDLPLRLDGTSFQLRVWEALGKIPPGQVRTYAELADAVGSARAARAVGQANRANRLPILIPCHRVVATGGGLGGYAGSVTGREPARKRWLLQHESAMAAPAPLS